MSRSSVIDYETYCEIMSDLMSPIDDSGLDKETLKCLYESKLIYLENLRMKCFHEINSHRQGPFSSQDLSLIISALEQTKEHLRDLVIVSLSHAISRQKILKMSSEQQK